MVKVKEKSKSKPNRKIVTGWLIIGDNGPLFLSVNKEKATLIFSQIQEKHKNATMEKITSHTQRFKQIGRHLITLKLPPYVKKHQILLFRNTLVKQTFQSCWESVRKKYGLSEDIQSLKEASMWLLDLLRYYTKELE